MAYWYYFCLRGVLSRRLASLSTIFANAAGFLLLPTTFRPPHASRARNTPGRSVERQRCPCGRDDSIGVLESFHGFWRPKLLARQLKVGGTVPTKTSGYSSSLLRTAIGLPSWRSFGSHTDSHWTGVDADPTDLEHMHCLCERESVSGHPAQPRPCCASALKVL